jgi:hypothetical protein
LSDFVDEGAAGRRQYDAVGIAFEERNSDGVFNISNPTTDCRRLDVLLSRYPSEADQFSNADDRAQFNG